jgi:uncharacterized protein involved in exopolysaccharide biosynthesis
LRDYLDIVLRRKWLVLAVLIGSLIVTLFYTYTAKRFYTSVAVIEIEGKKEKHKGKVTGSADYDEFQRYFLTHQEILRSRHLAEALVTEMNLTESAEFRGESGSWAKGVRAWFTDMVTSWSGDGPETGDAVPEEVSRISGVAGALVGRIAVKPVKTSNLISVSMDATSPAFAQQLLQNHLDLYFRSNLENRRKESKDAAAWLKEELDKSQKKLRESRAALVSFTVDHGIVDSADGGLQQVLQMVSKTMEGHLKSAENRASIQALQKRNAPELSSSLPTEMRNEFLDKLREELASVESGYSEMLGVYSTNYPKMRMMEKRMKFLRERISQVEEKVVESALDTAKTREQLLKQYYEGAKAEADRVKSLEAQYSLLKNAVDTTEEFHKIMLKEYKEMEIKARTTSNNIRVIDPCSLPLGPSKPNKKMLLMIGGLLGVIGGLLVAMVVEALDDAVRTPQEVEQNFDVRALGAVPDAEKLTRATGLPALNTSFDFVAFASLAFVDISCQKAEVIILASAVTVLARTP